MIISSQPTTWHSTCPTTKAAIKMSHDQWGPHWSSQLYRESLNKPLLDRESGNKDEDTTVDNKNTLLSMMARGHIMTACVIAASGCEYSWCRYIHGVDSLLITLLVFGFPTIMLDKKLLRLQQQWHFHQRLSFLLPGGHFIVTL